VRDRRELVLAVLKELEQLDEQCRRLRALLEEAGDVGDDLPPEDA
jgi:hypothetical protein